MRILFVYSSVDVCSLRQPLPSFGDIHIGLSYISENLKKKGHFTKVVVLCSEIPRASWRSLQGVVTEYDPEIIAFTSVSTQFVFLSEMAAFVKDRWPHKFLLIGGAHATLNPEETLKGSFDAVCVGEGEEPAVELASRLSAKQAITGIANLWIKGSDGVIERNTPRPFLDDLDAYQVDREMWVPLVSDKAGHRHVVLLGRGCPFDCAYCSNHAFRKIASGEYVRYRSPASIVDEIRQIKAKWPAIRDVYLQAETIGFSREWLFDLSRQLREFNSTLPSPIAFTCNLRVASNYVSREIFSVLADANVRSVEIGLESGSERLRREVLKRSYSNDEFIQAVALAREHGMKVTVYNMIGLPGETPADYMETVRINHICNPDRSSTSIFHPYPGTRLYRECRERGLLDGIDLYQGLERRKAVLSFPGFSRPQIQHAYNWFEFGIYRGHRSLLYRLRKVARNVIGSQRLVYRLFLKFLPLWQGIRVQK